MGGRAVFTVFISRERFEDLPDEAQNALLETSGGVLAAKLGAIMDSHDAFGLKRFTDEGIDVSTASQEFVDEIFAAGEFIEETWTETATGLGIDAMAALDHFRGTAAGR